MLFHTQNWLRSNNFDYAKLQDQLGIKPTFHPTDNRVILNYSQIDSPKSNEIVRECRGLVLDKTNGDLVARAFPRFFNWGELEHEEKWFVWENCYVNHKEDGSLILLYYYNGEWHINTRGSFGQGEVIKGLMTWRELFEAAFTDFHVFKQIADKSFTYVFELCSQYNKVVRQYPNPTLYLLSAYNGHHELNPEVVDCIAAEYGLNRPLTVKCNDIFDAMGYICKLEVNDKTFEGVVIRDINNKRWKVKNPSYIALHRLADNGNLMSAKKLLPLVLTGEIDEIITYFPEIKDRLYALKAELEREFKMVDNIWFCHHDQPSQKKFAQTVLKETKFSHILFEARKKGVHPKELWTYENLAKYFE
jgi:hypothetical protein